MTHSKTKEQQIADVKSQAQKKIRGIETEFKIRDIIPDVDFKFITSNNCAVFNVTSRDEMDKVLQTFPPINKSIVIKPIGKEKIVNSSYRVDIDNPATVNSVSRHEMRISYVTDDINVTIKLPIDMVEEYVYEYQRKINDTEYHYFTGLSHRQLRDKKVRAYKFKNSNVITWYGGTHTQLDETYIKNIINGEPLGSS